MCSRQVGKWQLNSKNERSLHCLLAKATWWIKCNYITSHYNYILPSKLKDNLIRSVLNKLPFYITTPTRWSSEQNVCYWTRRLCCDSKSDQNKSSKINNRYLAVLYSALFFDISPVVLLYKQSVGQVDRAFTTETVNPGSIPGWFKPKTIKIDILSFPAWRSAIKRDSMKPPPCVVVLNRQGLREGGQGVQWPRGPWAEEGPIEISTCGLKTFFFWDHLISTGKIVRISVKTFFFWDHLLFRTKLQQFLRLFWSSQNRKSVRYELAPGLRSALGAPVNWWQLDLKTERSLRCLLA